MLKNYIKGSNIIELVSEDSNEDATQHKAVLRIVGKTKDWSSLMVDLLMCPDDDSGYLVSVRKEFYISDENTPAFCWVLLIWGDVFEAFAELGPLLQRQTSVPRASQEPSAQADPVRSNRKAYRTEDGMRVVTTVALPFKRGRRDDPGTTRKLGDSKGVGAYVSNKSYGGL